MKSIKQLRERGLTIASIAILFFTRFYRLGLDITHNDAFYFKNNSYLFSQNIKSGIPKFFLTIQPGLLTVYSNILGYKAFFLMLKLSLIKASGKEVDLLVHTFQKIPQTSLNILVVLYIAYLLKNKLKILEKHYQISLFILFMALEPDFILHSRVIQNDMLQGLLILASLITYYYSRVSKKNKWNLFSGFLGGLSFLQKSSSIVLLGFIFLFEIYKNKKLLLNYKFKQTGLNIFKNAGLFLLAFSATTYILFPAYWFEPLETLKKMTLTIIFKSRGLESDFGFAKTPHIQEKMYYTKYFLVKYSLFYLFGIALTIYQLYFSKIHKKTKRFLLYLIYFSIFYVILLHISEKKIFRYMLVPTAILTPIAAFGYSYIFRKKERYLALLISIYLLFSFYTFISYFPDFGLYKNSGAKIIRYELPIDPYKGYVEGGTGLYKLAQYLNSKYPNKNVSLPRSDGIRLYLKASANELNFSKLEKSDDLVILNAKDPKINTLIKIGYTPIDTYYIRDGFGFTILGK